MIGKSDMTLYGWRQLIEWSLHHACMSDEERDDVYRHWRVAWDEFLLWVVRKYGTVDESEKAAPTNGTGQ